MSGALLRSGALREFFALGAVGHPVYQSATQLRVAMRGQIGADVADTFALPKRNDSGDTIDWYAPVDGPVVPWSSATEEERTAAIESLQAVRERVLSAGQRLEVEVDSERQVFGRLLQHVMTFPDDQHVYLVNGNPVLTFWGFRRHDGATATDSLSMLARTSFPAEAPVDTPVVNESPVGRRWPWWLWPLLLLFLMIPLLFWFRSCSEAPVVDLPADVPSDLPRQPVEEVVRDPVGVERRPVDVVPGAETAVTQDPRALPVDPLTEETVDPTAVEEEPMPEPQEITEPVPEEQPQEPETAPPAEEEIPEPMPEDMPTEPPVPPNPEMPQGVEPPPLTIPPEALEQGNVDFLNGRWSSNSGLIDETGRPVRLDYDFENGKGEVSLRRSDGTVCRGQTTADISQQRLVIADQGQIRCPDGQAFERSTVDCAVGASGRAECNGRYESGSAFPVEIRQAEQQAPEHNGAR